MICKMYDSIGLKQTNKQKNAEIIINPVDALQRLMRVCFCMQTNCIQLPWFSSCTQSSIVSRRSNKSTRSLWQISPELKGRYESSRTDCCQLCVSPIQAVNNDHQCRRLLCQGKGRLIGTPLRMKVLQIVSITKKLVVWWNLIMLISFMPIEWNFHARFNILLKFKEIKDLASTGDGSHDSHRTTYNIRHSLNSSQCSG